MRWRVVCAFLEVMETCAPTSSFRSVDLPTLGRPTMATVPARKPRGRHAAPALRLRHQAEHRLRGLLLGGPAARALAHRRRRPSSSTRHSTRKTWLVRLPADGEHDVARQRQAPALQVLLQGRLRVLGRRGLARAVDAARRRAPRPRRAPPRSPASRKTAPSSASKPSARIEGRRKPPLFSSPSPSRSSSPSSRACAISKSDGLVHEPGAQAREVALGQARQALEEEDRRRRS